MGFQNGRRVQTKSVLSVSTTEALRDLVLHLDDGGARVLWPSVSTGGGCEARGRRRSLLIKLSSWAP